MTGPQDTRDLLATNLSVDPIKRSRFFFAFSSLEAPAFTNALT